MPETRATADEVHAIDAALRHVTQEVAAARAALLGPEKARIEEGAARLEQAGTVYREALQPVLKHRRIPAGGNLRRDLAALRRELAAAAGLARSGAALYQGLARSLGAAAGGYTAQGDGAPLQPSGRVWVRG